MRWNHLLLIPLFLGCTGQPDSKPTPKTEAVATERGAIPDIRGSREVAGRCTLWWAAERLEIECQERVPLVVYHLVGTPAVSADGQRVAVSHRPGDASTARIEVVEFDGERWGEQRILVEDQGQPDRVVLDAGGDRVAYVDTAGGIAALWLVPFAGGEPLQLTNVGLADLPREPGQPPSGFVPVPLRDPPVFDGDRLVWTSAAGRHELDLP